jgi:hypothetical protein
VVTRSACLLLLSVVAAPAGMIINLNPDIGLAANSAALAAFQRAANAWTSRFSDNFTVNINAGLADLGNPSIIGQANSTLLQAGYTTIRTGLVADAANEAGNAIVASLPTAGQFTASVPNGVTLDGSVVLTQANANALGFGVNFGPDGQITFNSTFNFDFDSSDGVTLGLVDFETVAAHEIGHVLGFISAVDFIDAGLTAAPLTPFDLFRFGAAQVPTNAAQFTTNPRNLVPGSSAFFSDSVLSWAVSTGLSLGDGRQASHWKDDSLTGSFIGIMDPSLASGVVRQITLADLRTFDLIGYDAVPEPTTTVLIGSGLLMLLAWRRTTRA